MKHYKILPEFVPYWTSLTDEADESPVLTEAEIFRLAREWDVPVEDLMQQVEEYDREPDDDENDEDLTDEQRMEYRHTIAPSLYDGGWRPKDRDLMMKAYDLCDEAADIIIDEMTDIMMCDLADECEE